MNQVHKVRRDSKAPQVLLGVTELMAAMALMVAMVVMVLTALLVHVVLLVTRDRSAPWVRRVPPDQRGHRGSREHRALPDHLDRSVPQDQLGQRPPVSYAQPGLRRKNSRSTHRGAR